MRRVGSPCRGLFGLALLLAVGPLRAAEPAAALEANAAKLVEQRKLLEAEQAYRTALLLREQAVGPGKAPGDTFAVWRCRLRLAGVLIELMHFKEARGILEATQGQIAPALNHPTLAGFVQFEKVLLERQYARLVRRTGLTAPATQREEAALAQLRKVLSWCPGGVEYRRELVELLLGLAADYQETARPAEADRSLQEALLAARRLVPQNAPETDDVERLVRVLDAQAQLQREQGRFAQAAELLREAIRLTAEQAPRSSHRARLECHLPRLYQHLGLALQSLQRPAEQQAALREAERARARLNALPTGQRPATADDAVLPVSFNPASARLETQAPEVGPLYREAEADVRAHPEVPAFQVRLASAHLAVGVRLLATERTVPQAGQHLREAVWLASRLVETWPDVPCHRLALAETQMTLGLGLLLAGNRRPGLEVFQQGYALLERLAGDFPAEPHFRCVLVEQLHRLGLVQARQGGGAEALATLQRALDAAQRLAGAHPGCWRYRRQAAELYAILATQLLRGGQQQAADFVLRESVRQWTRLAQDFPANPEYRRQLAQAWDDLGWLLAEQDAGAEAEAAFGNALRLLRELSSVFPDSAAHRQRIAHTLAWIGQVHWRRKQLPEALTALSEAIAAQDKALLREPDRLEWLRQQRSLLEARARLARECGRTDVAGRDDDRVRRLGARLDPPAERLARLRQQLEAGEAARAVAEAEDLFRAEGLDERQWTELAAFYARALEKMPDAAWREPLEARAVLALDRAAGRRAPDDMVQRADFRRVMDSKK